ncbi:MAG: hypothetical protein B6240_04745, partial [Desulfobacteraceae bacterium 4572_87]
MHKPGTPFSPETICGVLKKRNLISPNQEKMILARRREIEQKIAQSNRRKKSNPLLDGSFSDRISIIDVILFMNLKRADQPEKVLDEERIYQVMADEWKVPYQKI